MKKPTFSKHAASQGVALVTTVIVVAVLAVVAVAFMQSTTVDRLSSRSAANYFRADLAAEAGLAAASATLARASTNDTFIVVANTNGQLFIGNGSSNSVDYSYIPAFSTTSSLSNAAAPIVTAGVPTTNVPGGQTFTFQLPGGASVTSPPLAWVYLTNADGTTNARFAYWVEDLSGKIDLSVMGAATTDPAARRPTGVNPAEIALWSVLSNAASAAQSGGAGNDLVAARSNLLTPATARLASTAVTTNMLAEMASRLRHDLNEVDTIPFGFGYADAGRPKYNLNTNLSAAGVTAIANAINQNLPQFGSRGGAMPAAAYVNGIAASIIDYADADANPTVDNAANPTYLGIENIPWPNELFDQIQFLGVTDSGQIRVTLRDWIEVWNMGNKPSAATTLGVSNNYDMILTFTNSSLRASFKANLKDAQFETGAIGRRDFAVPVLQPNAYAVVPSSSTPPFRTLFWPIPDPAWISTNAAVKNAWGIFGTPEDETLKMTFSAFVGPTVIQRSRGGRWPRYVSSASRMRPAPTTPNRFIFANPVGFASQVRPSSATDKPWHSGGDPRAQLFLSGTLRSQNYTNRYSSPGGRNWEKYWVDQSRFPESEVNPRLLWPDNGHTNTADRGGSPTGYDQNPDTFTRAPVTNNHVMRRNDSGSFTNVVELGNVYDPFQWGDSTALPAGVNDQPGMWTNLTTSATPDARFGGRNTLRVGRWEFSRFTNNGSRSSQLLDLFAVGPTNGAGHVVSRIPGRINLNTASTNALRALAAGVFHSSDPELLPNGTNFVVPTNAVSAFVTGVTARRSQRPFFTPSELAMAATNSSWPAGAVFGNSNLATVRAWNDGAAEEWFAKVFPLATVRSRNFAVHVVGQALQTNNLSSVLSSVNSTFQIHVEPVRNTNNGTISNCIARVLQSWTL